MDETSKRELKNRLIELNEVRHNWNYLFNHPIEYFQMQIKTESLELSSDGEAFYKKFNYEIKKFIQDIYVKYDNEYRSVETLLYQLEQREKIDKTLSEEKETVFTQKIRNVIEKKDSIGFWYILREMDEPDFDWSVMKYFNQKYLFEALKIFS